MHNVYEEQADIQAYNFWTRQEKPVQKAVLTDGQEKAVGILSRDLASKVGRVVDEYATLVASNGTVKPEPMMKASPEPFHVSKASTQELNSMSLDELLAWLQEHDPAALVRIAQLIREQYGQE
jgi:hypothetical protein